MPVQIDLSSNRLCGVYLEHGTWGKQMGTYDDKGIRAIAHAMGVSRSLTQVQLESALEPAACSGPRFTIAG